VIKSNSSGPNTRSGAIAAMSTTGNFYGHSFGRSSQAEAEREALANCNRQAGVADACEIATWFSDGCGALAIGSDGAWDADRAKTTAEASAKALKAFAPRTIAAHVQWSLFIASAAGLA